MVFGAEYGAATDELLCPRTVTDAINTARRTPRQNQRTQTIYPGIASVNHEEFLTFRS